MPNFVSSTSHHPLAETLPYYEPLHDKNDRELQCWVYGCCVNPHLYGGQQDFPLSHKKNNSAVEALCQYDKKHAVSDHQEYLHDIFCLCSMLFDLDDSQINHVAVCASISCDAKQPHAHIHTSHQSSPLITSAHNISHGVSQRLSSFSSFVPNINGYSRRINISLLKEVD